MRILDLFCGAGGAGMGYSYVDFEVIGVDINPQPSYPFTFFQLDAIDLLNHLLDDGMMRDDSGNTYKLDDFDAIHASPPCQSSSALTKGTNFGREYPDFIPQTRQLLEKTGLPFVIENVQGSEVRRDLTLCGEMFGLEVIRHRYFECSFPVVEPAHIKHRGRVAGWRHGVYYEGPYVAVYGDGGGKGKLEDWKRAMDIDWMQTKKELAESIPPCYTEYIGFQLHDHLVKDLGKAP